MATGESLFHGLSKKDFRKIKTCAVLQNFCKDELIFAEGDQAGNIYFIESGHVSIFLQKFASKEEISTLGPGEYFGEMAVLNNDKRTASVRAMTDATLLCVAEKDFYDLVTHNQEIADKLQATLSKRNEELILKEKLVDRTGVKTERLHVCIKGDPSLRETSFTREKYESVVDDVLAELAPRLQDLLLNRAVYQIFVGFNNGEIRISSIFDPFNEEIHQATKLVDSAYIKRHFPEVGYTEKIQMLKRLYHAIASDSAFGRLPETFQKSMHMYYTNWKPITEDEISNTLSQLPTLRGIPNFYLRNFTISMTRNAIRLQFNCDGTHFVSSKDYQQFIDDYL